MKINKIHVHNFKAISDEQLSLNGCSAIITAGNNKGKTSLLRGLVDRFRGEKPDIIVKDGEEKGFNYIELEDGSKIEWKFTDKTESFAYITKEGIKQTTGVLTTIGARYFGTKFDIDKFLNSPSAKQVQMLQELVGIDFKDIDVRYKKAYEGRADANKEVARLRGLNIPEPKAFEKPDIKAIQSEIDKVRILNSNLKKEWSKNNSTHLSEIVEYNKTQSNIKASLKNYSNLKDLAESNMGSFIDLKSAEKYIESLPKPKNDKPIKNLPEPKYKSESDLIQKLNKANADLRSYDNFVRDREAYNKWIKEGLVAKKTVEDYENKLKEIKKEKLDLIESANLPDGFKISDTDILYNGYPLNDSQISSSSKYIAALKLGLMVLGDIRTMHFDASFLDRQSLEEVQLWAEENDLQLLIERPDFDGGELKYEFLNNK